MSMPYELAFFFQNKWLFLLFYTVSRDKFAVREDESTDRPSYIRFQLKDSGSQCDCEIVRMIFTFLHVFVLLLFDYKSAEQSGKFDDCPASQHNMVNMSPECRTDQHQRDRW